MKTRILLSAALLFTALAAPASAACFADYKAKKDNPLRLHYGVAELPEAACADRSAAKKQISGRVASDGWQLLNILSMFGAEGLDQRRESAGNYYLRY